ncbi:ABC transporter ATP-binding protein [Kribbella solani]|uniref:ABC-type glutathione transport system ATPase component n=1 Tax=Kribbella solani TaxID=236067 RepID=A0A841DVN4_9ACTN|nr:ABC transporter ATP-binding protein [Kribbella solani]MBB5980895.1 ABC-type glutathione transport system ATPase component [Kribbella solani]
MASDKVLAVSGLGIAYGRGPDTVSGFDLDILPGDRVGIIGESGSGKSTVALGMFGLLPPPGRITKGTVEVHGVDVATMTPRGRRQIHGRTIGLIYQDASTSLDPLKRVGSQVAEAIRAHQDVRGKALTRMVAAALEGVNLLERHARSYPHELSGGMRQRAAIAIALVNNPDLVIADEPTSALDVTTQATVLKLLDERVTTQGCALVLVTHDLGVVADHCDLTIVMHQGRAVERGDTDAVLTKPRHRYTQSLVDCYAALDDNDLERLPTDLLATAEDSAASDKEVGHAG